MAIRVLGVFFADLINNIILLPGQRAAARDADAQHIDPFFITRSFFITVKFQINTMGFGQSFGFPGNIITA